MNVDDLWIGDRLKIRSTGQVGTFHGVKNHVVLIKVGEDVLESTIDQLEFVDEEITNDAIVDDGATQDQSIDLQGIAEFHPEIDLHFDALTRAGKKISNAHPLQDQLRECNSFLSHAFSLGVTRVRVIHGIGNGILKNEVAHILDESTFVSDFEPSFDGGSFIAFLIGSH